MKPAAYFAMQPTRENPVGDIVCRDGSRVACDSRYTARACAFELALHELISPEERYSLLVAINEVKLLPDKTRFPAAVFCASQGMPDIEFEPDGVHIEYFDPVPPRTVYNDQVASQLGYRRPNPNLRH